MSSLVDDLGFVIIGRNEGERLKACLASTLSISHRVVYADSRSTDGSADCARDMGASVIELDAFAHLNAATGRNAGFGLLRARFPECRFVQFLDGDCVLEPQWVRTGIDFLQAHPKVAIVCGRRFEAHPELSFYNRLADREWNTPTGPADACGGDAMMRVAAFEEIGGFNGALMASEEPEFAARLRAAGWEIWRLDADMTEHDAAMLHFRQWWRRTVRSGYGYAQAWRSTRHLSEPVNQARLRSAVIWVICLPVAIVLLTIAARLPGLLSLVPLLWGAQIVRLTVRQRGGSIEDLRSSAMLMLGKVPELMGAARALLTSRQSDMIEYKKVSAVDRSRPAK